MDIPGGSADAAAIHAAFAGDIEYTGGGLSGATIGAVEIDDEADDFMGGGESIRSRAFEILQSDMPEDPDKGDTLIDAAGDTLRVIGVTRRDDVGSWIVHVELDL